MNLLAVFRKELQSYFRITSSLSSSGYFLADSRFLFGRNVVTEEAGLIQQVAITAIAII